MIRERIIRIVAGTFVLISLALGIFHSEYWFIFTAFVGINLLQSGITKWCLLNDILRKFKVGESAVEDKDYEYERV